MNSIRQWIRRAAEEAGSPEALRNEALKLKDKSPHAAQLLYRFAARWGAKIMRGEAVHWASPKKTVDPLQNIPEE